jgi:hypothetical protein
MAPGKQSSIVFTGLYLCFCASIQADEPEGIDQLVEVYYRFEVAAVYCGLINELATKGYYFERHQIVEEFALNEAEQLHASGKASQLAHKEWMNRGLGGFKPWCRKEGREYTDGFVEQSSLESNQ